MLSLESNMKTNVHHIIPVHTNITIARVQYPWIEKTKLLKKNTVNFSISDLGENLFSFINLKIVSFVTLLNYFFIT